MVRVTLEDGRVIEVDGATAAIIHALTEFQSRLVTQQGKLKMEINVAGGGDEIQIRPMPVYVYNRKM
jgi:exosome complex RNA-binding protein Rrp42 (RNase PH superfamily)